MEKTFLDHELVALGEFFLANEEMNLKEAAAAFRKAPGGFTIEASQARPFLYPTGRMARLLGEEKVKRMLDNFQTVRVAERTKSTKEVFISTSDAYLNSLTPRQRKVSAVAAVLSATRST